MPTSDDIVELTSAPALRAQAIAAELEEAGIDARLHELRGLQTESNNVWRIFVFARDLERARGILATIESRAADVEPVHECPACGHAIGGRAVAKCPECGLAFSESGVKEAKAHSAERLDRTTRPREPGSVIAWVFAGVLGVMVIVAVVLQVVF